VTEGDLLQRASVLRRRTLATLLLLVVQFLLGMGTNLFVTIPAHHPGSAASSFWGGAVESLAWSFTSGLPVLIAHVVVGLLLILSSIELVVHGLRARRAPALWLAVGGLLGIVAAAINGASFLEFQLNLNSMLMSAGFALAVGCYVVLLSLRD